MLECDNGKSGYAMACCEIPDLIVSDIMMAVADGTELIEAIKDNDETHSIPVILLTELEEDFCRSENLSPKASGYLTKPFAGGVLTECVASSLGALNK